METFLNATLGFFGGLGAEAQDGTSVRLIPLLVLAASLLGLAWLAYKRPAVFVQRICPYLALLLFALLVLGLAWNLAVSVAPGLLHDSAPFMAWIQTDALRDGLQFPHAWLLAVFGGGGAYFLFLYRLLRRFAAGFQPPALGRPPSGSPAARASHGATHSPPSLS